MTKSNLSRREFLHLNGAALGGLALAGSTVGHAVAQSGTCIDPNSDEQKNDLFYGLQTCCTNEPLADGEMRISFLGTSCIPRLSQQGVSVYVEVGPTHLDPINGANVPLDYAMFDCGMGVMSNYLAMNIPYGRMDKIFIAHLHADHMSELSAIYCFGESSDRKGPLYVWGPGKSGVPDPVSGQIYDDGLKTIMEHFREVWRWHTESFSFDSNSYKSYPVPSQYLWRTPVPLVPVGQKYRTLPNGKPVGPRYADPYGMTPDGKGGSYATYDAYALVPIELDWTKSGKGQIGDLPDNVAYWNRDTGLKITHFPAIHTRKGAISYKLEWNGLSMIYSGDTKPNNTMVAQAGGVDVLVHEMVMPPDQWIGHMLGIPADQVPPEDTQFTATIENSSHTTQGAFGYLMTQIKPLPRLTVATHFQAQNDTIACAQASLDAYGIPRSAYTFASDLMVLKVSKDSIQQYRADVSRYAFSAPAFVPSDPNPPKYHDANGQPDPYAQIDRDDEIEAGCDTYDAGGYWPGSYGEGCK